MVDDLIKVKSYLPFAFLIFPKIHFLIRKILKCIYYMCLSIFPNFKTFCILLCVWCMGYTKCISHICVWHRGYIKCTSHMYLFHFLFYFFYKIVNHIWRMYLTFFKIKLNVYPYVILK